MQPTAVTAVAVAIAPAEASKDHRMRGSNARGMDIQPTAPFVSRRGLSNTNQRRSLIQANVSLSSLWVYRK